MPTRYVPTVEAYDSWAGVYDSDGNVLQAVDEYELGAMGGGMMHEFVAEILQQANSASRGNEKESVELVDLGCGTGRNTVVLLEQEWPLDMDVTVTGIDASKGMLAVAAEKLKIAVAKTQRTTASDQAPTSKRQWNLLQHDFLDPKDATRPPILMPPMLAAGGRHAPNDYGTFDGLITTLVLEHFPLHTFFTIIKSLVKPGGVVLVTNMHSDMGSQSQAGFVAQDEKGEAVKIRGTSWVHGTQQTVDAAREAGFEVVEEVRERAVTEEMVRQGIVGERGAKWRGVNVWYGMLLRHKP